MLLKAATAANEDEEWCASVHSYIQDNAAEYCGSSSEVRQEIYEEFQVTCYQYHMYLFTSIASNQLTQAT